MPGKPGAIPHVPARVKAAMRQKIGLRPIS